MKKLFLVFIFLCFSISLGFANNSALDYFNAGKKFQQRENFTRAIEYYQEALLINPDYADAWIGLAECAYEMDEYSRALTCLETANKYYKYNLKIQRLKGFCYIGLGELEKANDIFDEILKNSQMMLKRFLVLLNFRLLKVEFHLQKNITRKF